MFKTMSLTSLNEITFSFNGLGRGLAKRKSFTPLPLLATNFLPRLFYTFTVRTTHWVVDPHCLLLLYWGIMDHQKSVAPSQKQDDKGPTLASRPLTWKSKAWYASAKNSNFYLSVIKPENTKFILMIIRDDIQCGKSKSHTYYLLCATLSHGKSGCQQGFPIYMISLCGKSYLLQKSLHIPPVTREGTSA